MADLKLYIKRADWDNVQEEPSLKEAGETLGMGMDTLSGALDILRLTWKSDKTVEIFPNMFKRASLYDIYWGDDQQNFVAALSDSDRKDFEEGIRQWLRESRNIATKKYKVNPKDINLSSTVLDQQPSTEDLGKAIAEQLGNGVVYKGPQYRDQLPGNPLQGYMFNDGLTGTSFMCKDLEECKESLLAVRERFKTEAPNWQAETYDEKMARYLRLEQERNLGKTTAAGIIQQEQRRAFETPEPDIAEEPEKKIYDQLAYPYYLEDQYRNSTVGSLNFLRDFKSKIGEFEKAVCDGNSLVIEGSTGRIRLTSCNCGNSGEGPRGTETVLIELGVSPARAAALMIKPSFDINLKKPAGNTTGVPIRLTMEEFNRDWKPDGWAYLPIGPTPTWREEWGEWEAIREIVQNALDETEAYQFGFEQFSARGRPSAMSFYIKDAGQGIPLRGFMLGPAVLKQPGAHGKYGEGMKIGALALLRMGYPIYFETGNYDVIICFLQLQIEKETADSLCALWKPGMHHQGTTLHIINYRGETYKDRFAVNLPKTAIKALVPSQVETPKQRYNALIEYDFSKDGGDSKSRIFSRDIYLEDIDSPFSYNLWDFELAPDRHAPVSDKEMWEDVGRVWACIKEQKLLETFLKMTVDPAIIKSDENHQVSLDYLGRMSGGKAYADIMKENQAVWQKAWDKVTHPDPTKLDDPPAVIRTDSRWDSAVKHLGYKSVSVGYSVKAGLKGIIKTDVLLKDESQSKLQEVATIPDNELTARELASLNLIRAIVNFHLHYWDEGYRVKGVHAAIIPPASDRVRTAGLYSRTTQEIYLAADQLEKASVAIDVGIHELAHHVSQAEDLEEKHVNSISELAGKVVSYVYAGKFDEIIKNPEFVW